MLTKWGEWLELHHSQSLLCHRPLLSQVVFVRAVSLAGSCVPTWPGVACRWRYWRGRHRWQRCSRHGLFCLWLVPVPALLWSSRDLHLVSCLCVLQMNHHFKIMHTGHRIHKNKSGRLMCQSVAAMTHFRFHRQSIPQTKHLPEPLTQQIRTSQPPILLAFTLQWRNSLEPQ